MRDSNRSKVFSITYLKISSQLISSWNAFKLQTKTIGHGSIHKVEGKSLSTGYLATQGLYHISIGNEKDSNGQKNILELIYRIF